MERSTVKEQEKYRCTERLCVLVFECGVQQVCVCVCVCVCALIYGTCALHLSNGFGQVGGYFCQSLPSAVHNVVTAGAGLWAL